MPSREAFLNRRRVAALGTSLAVCAAMVGLRGAMARNDDGAKTFFMQPAAIVVPDVALDHPRASWGARPLTIERGHRFATRRVYTTRVAARFPPRIARGKGWVKPLSGPVTLMTDATLIRGDAVMTMAGIRIFTGAMAFPHRDADFVRLKGIGGVPRSVARTLLAMDSLPRD